MRPELILFDLDHTLLQGDSDVLWCDFLIENGVLERGPFAQKNADMELRYKVGTVGIQEFADFYVGTLKGRSPTQWEPMRQRFLSASIAPRISQRAMDCVASHQRAGDTVVLTTATNRFITELTAHHLGIAHLIATEPQLQTGVFTGKTSGVLNMREGKVTRLHDWLAARGQTVSEFATTAYSDSINDLPLLTMADTAIAVDPDVQLLAHAKIQGWQVASLADQ